MCMYVNLYVCKRTHDIGENPSVGQPLIKKTKFQTDYKNMRVMDVCYGWHWMASLVLMHHIAYSSSCASSSYSYFRAAHLYSTSYLHRYLV
ncbi:hypothetical protein SFRURICE_018511, partial [Spodoptera frugiperda]